MAIANLLRQSEPIKGGRGEEQTCGNTRAPKDKFGGSRGDSQDDPGDAWYKEQEAGRGASKGTAQAKGKTLQLSPHQLKLAKQAEQIGGLDTISGTPNPANVVRKDPSTCMSQMC